MKKKAPIVVLERITPIINKNRVLLTTLRDENVFLSVKDSDRTSISKFEDSDAGFFLII